MSALSLALQLPAQSQTVTSGDITADIKNQIMHNAPAPKTVSIEVPLSDKFTDDQGVQIVGLAHVLKQKKAHRFQRSRRIYEYKMADGCSAYFPMKLKNVKDLREYAEKHPKRQGFIDWCERWQPVPQFFSSTAQAGAYTTAPSWLRIKK